ncbi:MAG: GNAT family N-acetyltransferase [Burkholderiales bacterium]|nr:GNAT family N-acetyltransferase [Burkholderiales bacterium]
MRRYLDLSWNEAKEAHFSAWRDLVAGNDFNPSLLPGWMQCARAVSDDRPDWRVFLEFDEREMLTGVIPYFLHEIRLMGIRARAVELGGNLVSYHQEIISAGGQKNLLREFMALVRGWDLMRMFNIAAEGKTATVVSELAGEKGCLHLFHPGESSPYLPIAGKWEDYLSTKSKRHRYRLRRQEKSLQEEPDWVLKWFEGEEGCDDLLADMLKIEAGSWKASAGMDIPGRPAELEYHCRLLPMLAKEGMLLANVLYMKGEPAAYGLCYRWNAAIGQMKTSYQERFREDSPGALVLISLLRRAFDEGCEEFDFLGDEMEHKTIWDTESRRHVSILLFGSTLKGRMLGLAKQLQRRVGKRDFRDANQGGTNGRSAA